MRLTRLICLASALLCLPMCAAPAVAQSGGQYQAAPRTLTNGERNDLLLDVNGRLVTSSSTRADGTTVAENATLTAGKDSAGLKRTFQVDDAGRTIVRPLGGTVASNNGLPNAYRTMLDDSGGAIRLEVVPRMLNALGTLDVLQGDATGGLDVQGSVAHATADSGNPVKIGARVATSKPVSTAGMRTDLLADVSGNLFVRPVTTILSGLNGLSAVWGAAGANDNPSYAGAPIGALGFMYNGTTVDAVRGDTTAGLYVQERARSQYGFDLPGILSAGQSYLGATRDGGASPSQWSTFSCFVRSDQASAAGGFGIQGSNDGTNWIIKVLTSVSAGTSTRVTDRNDTRYSRCVLTNGATANTVAPNMNYSFGL